jgi:hypothetical protein
MAQQNAGGRPPAFGFSGSSPFGDLTSETGLATLSAMMGGAGAVGGAGGGNANVLAAAMQGLSQVVGDAASLGVGGGGGAGGVDATNLAPPTAADALAAMMQSLPPPQVSALPSLIESISQGDTDSMATILEQLGPLMGHPGGGVAGDLIDELRRGPPELWNAAQHGNCAEITRLLDAGEDVNRRAVTPHPSGQVRRCVCHA